MPNLIEVALLEQMLQGKDLPLFYLHGTIYAMDDGCLRHGLSLGASHLDRKIVTSRGHGWKYDVTTRSTLNSPGYGVATYQVRIVDEKIVVAIDEPNEKSGFQSALFSSALACCNIVQYAWFLLRHE